MSFSRARNLFILLLLCAGFPAAGQENEQVYIQGRRYLDINIHSLEKYAKRIERTQHRLLQKLQHKEQKLAGRLLRTDSAAYARLKAQPLSFDSISKLALHPDSATLASRSLRGGQKAVDSLKGVYNFLQSKAGKVTNNSTLNKAAELTGYNNELSALQGKLNYQQHISDLTNQHANSLQGIAGKNSNITGIQKELYYAKAKMAEWKKMANDPSLVEEKALEYLQGTKGFDGYLNNALNSNGNPNSANAGSVDDLEKMGFQTKRQLNAQLQQKFGNNLSAVQGNVGKQVSDWQSKAQNLQGQLKETKQSITGLKHTAKPAFKINPMRGMPFLKRLEKQYSFQTARATTTVDGTDRPAILTLAAGVAYNQSPKLSIGIGLAGDVGLGQNWSSIRFSFEGIGARSFLTWEWQYGIGLYGGYERTFKRFTWRNNNDAVSAINTSTHSTQTYNESVLLGLKKNYKINSKWSGSIQILYDIWYQDKNLRSPLVLRFINTN